MEWIHKQYKITTNPDRFDPPLIQRILAESYWAKGIPIDVVIRSIEGSMGFAVLDADENQVGFARVITDKATFAYIADVFVLPNARGQGLRQWTLFTADAHGLYRQSGFEVYSTPEKFMVFSDFEGYG